MFVSDNVSHYCSKVIRLYQKRWRHRDVERPLIQLDNFVVKLRTLSIMFESSLHENLSCSVEPLPLAYGLLLWAKLDIVITTDPKKGIWIVPGISHEKTAWIQRNL